MRCGRDGSGNSALEDVYHPPYGSLGLMLTILLIALPLVVSNDSKHMARCIACDIDI